MKYEANQALNSYARYLCTAFKTNKKVKSIRKTSDIKSRQIFQTLQI